jgi:dihydrodipicolinate synthase/N-acetylneuraminate lyase
MFSSLAGVAPKLVAELFRICRTENYFDARSAQEQAAELRQIVKRAGAAGLKGAITAMGRDVGKPRPPLASLTSSGRKKLNADIEACAALRDEPRGW